MQGRRRYSAEFMKSLNQPSKLSSRKPGYELQQKRGNDWKQICDRYDMLRKIGGARVFAHGDAIHEAVISKDLNKLGVIEEFHGELNERNFCDHLQALIKVDEVYAAISSRRFDMFNQRLFVYADCDSDISEKGDPSLSYYKVRVKGLSDGELSLIMNDLVVMIDSSTSTVKIFKIVSIIGDFLVMSKHRLHGDEKFLKRPLDIYFVSSGLIYKYYEKALEQAKTNPYTLARIFEAEPEFIRELGKEFSFPLISIDRGEFVELDERLDRLNEHQRRAVEGILTAECRPKPYIVFGPPGTGKTHTLVEAIVQIYVRERKAMILFCANSNTCADQMVEKLSSIELISKEDVHRLNAGAKTVKVKSSRILVTTNIKSASLLGKFEYDWVFIDEAGHANEPETMLPICSVKKFGCLVLAGDHKQLGPVAQCEQVAKYGLGTSMFERIFEFKVYQRDPETDKYDNRYITKLLLCYRCDPRVLAISNKLFYKNELECLNETPKSLLKMMNLSGPVQFNHVRGNEFQPKNSTSWLNEDEAASCADLIIRLYEMGFEPDQIGVISPYKLQVNMIRKKLDAMLQDGRPDLLEERFQKKALVMRVTKKVQEETEKKRETPAKLVFLTSEQRRREEEELKKLANDSQGTNGSDDATSESNSRCQSLSDLAPNLEQLDLGDDVERTERRIIATQSMQTEFAVKTCENPWTLELEIEKTKAIEAGKLDTERLLKIFRGFLNKIMPQNYASIIEKINALNFGLWSISGELQKSISDLFVNKAVDEPIFYELYAQLFKVIAAKIGGNPILGKCQSEFKRIGTYCDLNVEAREEDIEREIDPAKKELLSAQLSEDMRLKRNKFLGIIKLIGELYNLDILIAPIICDIIAKLLTETSNEKLECLCSLITIVGAKIASEKNGEIRKSISDTQSILNEFANNEKTNELFTLESRIRFKILDTIDLIRMVKDNPKKLTEIHEKSRQRLQICSRGNMKDDVTSDKDEYEEVEEIVKRKDKWVCKIDTVDAFQGNEREIIIISTVRTPSGRRTDFIDDARRFNVALSRAKWLLFVNGHKDVLDDLSRWREYMNHAAHDEVSRWPKQSVFDRAFKQYKPMFKEEDM